jgi:hypothetical protein
VRVARRHLTLGLAGGLWLSSPPQASADPIFTPIIAAVLASTGIPATIFGISTAAVLSGLLTTAIGIGLAVAFAPHPRMPPPENGVVAVQQNVPYRIFVYGRRRVAGAIMLKEAIASQLVYVAAMAAHFIDAFESLYLNDDQVAVATSGNNFVGTVSAGADGRYSGSTVYVETRQGLATETNYGFITTLLPTDWSAAHRGDGQASLGMQCKGVAAQDFTKVYPYSAPSPSAVVRGYRVFDPRDPTQDPNDPSTFKWSENVAAGILHYICFSEFGFRARYERAILPWLSYWITALNICDEQTALRAGGTEARYRMGGWTTTEQARVTTLLTMLQCCDGFLSFRAGGYVLFAGKYADSGVVVYDSDIRSYTIYSDVSSEDKINEAVAYWADPDAGYVTVTTDPKINVADQAARGGAPRKAQLQLTWVQSPGQASRLLKREMFRQGSALRGTIEVGWSALNAAYERFFTIKSNSVSRLSDVIVEVRRASINARLRTVTIDWVISGPGLDDYDASVDETSPPLVPQRPTDVGLPVPANVNVVAELANDGTSTILLDVSWDQPFYNGNPWLVNYAVQWRTAGSPPGPWVQQAFTSPTIAAGRVEIQTNVVQSGVTLEVQVASVGSGASLSTWSATETISTRLPDVAPSPPTWTSATGGSGSVDLVVTAPLSTNVAYVKFFYATSGSPFSSATALGSPLAVTPGASLTHHFTGLAAGSYDYWAESLTSSSVASAPAGPVTAVAT